jgi:prophage tail gpP-like protein
MIALVIGGKSYSFFNEVNLDFRLDTLCDTFSFMASPESGDLLDIKVGDECQIFVEGILALTGFIEVYESTISADTHEFLLMGRDKTCDLLDSNIFSLSDMNAPITLKTVCEEVLKEIGSSLTVLDLSDGTPFEEGVDIVAPETGINAFSFLEIWARKKAVLLTSNAQGQLVISKSPGERVDTIIRHEKNSDLNNVLFSRLTHDITGRYNAYKFSSQLNVTALNTAGGITEGLIVDQFGTVTDKLIRKGRTLVLNAEEAYTEEECAQRALWESSIRRARGKVYSVGVDTFKAQTNLLWAPNQLVDIVDRFNGVDTLDLERPMLLNSVSFTYSVTAGIQAVLNFIDQDAYNIEREKIKLEEEVESEF